ncbi:MAG TPA: hypothetical protein PLF27_10975 [Sedimentibacter sp.]|jgi:hypothetical protein|nr:hypothetical protein [Sedimentibacter sp.]
MKEHDVVYLEDGRKGTIVHIYPDGENAEVEISETNEVVKVKLQKLN